MPGIDTERAVAAFRTEGAAAVQECSKAGSVEQMSLPYSLFTLQSLVSTLFG